MLMVNGFYRTFHVEMRRNGTIKVILGKLAYGLTICS